MRILVTGGAGYVGSHCVLDLLLAGHDVTVIDNLSNSKPTVIERVAELAGRPPDFVRADLRDADALALVFGGGGFDAVMHFAGLKIPNESFEQPLRYYDNNVGGTLALLAAMEAAGVRTLVFSSSAAVYSDPARVPISEAAPCSTRTPYGRTKRFVERLLEDVQAADPRWSVTLLRYFNVVGAHRSGRLGEDLRGPPTNLAPALAQVAAEVAAGGHPCLKVFGGDYPTPDGTGVRDFIHVSDLASGHLAALRTHVATPGCHTYNLGTGRGVSVLELHRAFEQACGQQIPYEIVPRRPGDVAESWSDPTRAHERLGWRATRTLREIAGDTWRWHLAQAEVGSR